LDLPDDLRAVLEARLQELGRLSGVQEAAAAETPMTVVLQLDVVLAAGFAAEDLSGRTLFVFAKAVDGPPMPLAVQKIVAPQLPLRVRLDDSMGMLPQHKLSQAERWLVTARLSSKGSVQAEAGDLEGTIEVNRADVSQPLQLLIDRRIQ
jgi:cytochrome c-type biogenesis protein CcmH